MPLDIHRVLIIFYPNERERMVQALVVVKILPYCHTLRTSLGLIIFKILQGESSLFSLSPPRCGNIMALLYKKLDMGSWSNSGPKSMRIPLKSNFRFTMYLAP